MYIDNVNAFKEYTGADPAWIMFQSYTWNIVKYFKQLHVSQFQFQVSMYSEYLLNE